MSSLTRQKPSANQSRHTDGPRFDELPEDVLILVCSQCRIDELFALRLTSRKTRSLITEYIGTIAPSVARSTFALDDLLLEPRDGTPAYTIDWLKGLIPQQLAAILVDRHRFSHDIAQQRYGIPAEDPHGNDLRVRIANGWRVLRRLSQISQEVYDLNAKCVLKSTTDLAWKVVHPSRYKYEVFRQREDLIFRRRIEYIRDMDVEMAKDYRVMFTLLSSVFRTAIANHGDDHKPWIFDWECGIDGQRLLRRGNSWLTWFILNEGPDLFWKQWQSLPPSLPSTKNYIRDRSIEAWFGASKIAPEDFISQFDPKEWADVNEKWHDIQRDYACKVQRALEERTSSGTTEYIAEPIGYFTRYAECRQLRAECGIEPPKEVLSHVPFHVDFRCPEALFEKFCTLKEDRALAMAAQTSRT
ncbi:hypothetical protein K504DRAFT_465638 [Pleomassaria siparia CBS 279.74]|uniref:F-box domain-containing protein n=1 Tax=Pleomassaria siparia CBS 279.74 TaxID=1314801 RepID=A0A6G1KH79_9PLEO|nr:hypothetical protein K504DRAFT_465638 [Pleomassaria siparia CBS 279.74]